MRTPSACGLSLLFLVAAVGPALARGGGGCLERGTPIGTPNGPVTIERLTPGDVVWSVVDGRLRPATVRACMETEPDEYVEITTAGRTLRATPEHPFQVEPGVFRTADRLAVGDSLWLWENDALQSVAVQSVQRVQGRQPAYNLLVAPGGTYLADGVAVHNKGCFLPETPILKGDRSWVPIHSIRPGDQVLAFTPDGTLVSSRVRTVLTHEVNEYILLTTGAFVLRVTPEHPFYVGNGTFRTVAALKPGDRVFTYDGTGLSAQPILSMQRVRASVRVYNLQTDAPNTFFAHGIAVHNKGGGCFPVGTPILTPDGPVDIEKLAIGDVVLAITESGSSVPSTVRSLYATRAPLLLLETGAGSVHTTADHPFWLGGDVFRVAGELDIGDRVMTWQEGRPQPTTIRNRRLLAGAELVFNLQVEEPHTFVAGGFVVHNKGGSGGGFGGGGFRGSGFRTYGSHGSGRSIFHANNVSASTVFTGVLIGSLVGIGLGAFLFWGGSRLGGGMGGGVVGGGLGAMIPAGLILLAALVLIAVIAFVSVVRKSFKHGSALDVVLPLQQVTAKASRTEKLLARLAQEDTALAPDSLRQTVEGTFRKLQQCWQARDNAPMKPLMMADLHGRHCEQLQGMRHNHEINVIGDLHVERVDLVHVRCTKRADQQTVTALITARAQDYYVDERTRNFLRGSHISNRFQEFWTFQRRGSDWLLREIEQTRESDILRTENVADSLTKEQILFVYQETEAGSRAPEMPRSRQDRLLETLVKKDPLWDRDLMLERARQLFTNLYMSEEAGNPDALRTEDIFPEVATLLREDFQRRRKEGLSLEYRNFCVRKAELVLVRNYVDDRKDEFTARVRAHAQKVVRRNGTIMRQDEDVKAFEEYWTFGRGENGWKLKEVLPPARGQKLSERDSLDEEGGLA